ncbi:trypsin-like peptidase domain-containing protein [Streptomyces geranii]|uniref:trypsin-like peptidase domain-containing protein n=1 Tax=Streptomyces geranii TaxID=2058923 RepID=UPI000D047586|nr:trypsin-like peptidase domain-containing protein [Streptomyces geranii]
MNEGKPAKTTSWWSRSRRDAGATSGRGESGSGQGELAAGEGLAGAEGSEGPLVGPELGSAEAEGASGGAGEVSAGSDAVRVGADEEALSGTYSKGDGDGDFALPPPTAAPGAAVPGVFGAAEVPSPVEPHPRPGGPLLDSPPTPPQEPPPFPDPGPDSTPPYGHPGPWAPAPPVQRPSVTPAHGTAVVGAQGAFDVSHASDGVPPEAPDAGPDPWRRYDPWAATPLQPLQHSGPAVRPAGARKRGLVVGALVLSLVSGGVGGAVGAYLERHGGVGDRIQLPQADDGEAVGRAPDSVAGIAARALPSVVTLHVRGDGAEGTGTGFVLDGRGHILTNNHVVEPAGADGEITVTFSGGETAEAEVVGRDSGYDLAVVKVSGVDGLQPVVLGNSDDVAVGDPVVAIGAPFDLANTVTAGIISAKERPITAGGDSGDGSDVSYVDALQTDAPINPGNSGGPLLDARARVVGINSAIRSADSASGLDGAQSGSIGLGFAIPINQGKRVAEELINTGKATHPVIGVTLDMDYSGDGARVGTEDNDGGPAVTTGGPGDRAGLEAGDIITEVDGRRVHSGEELIVKIRAHRPGDRLELSLLRGGRERTISLILGSSAGN